MADIWSFYDPVAYSGGWGAKATNAARAAGLTDNQIRSQLASSGLAIGGKAAEMLNVNAIQTYATPPAHIKGGFDGYNTRPVLLPRGVFANAGKPNQSGLVYVSGGRSDADVANFFATNGAELPNDVGPYQHGSRGTYFDTEWDSYQGGGMALDGSRKNYFNMNTAPGFSLPSDYVSPTRQAAQNRSSSGLSISNQPQAPRKSMYKSQASTGLNIGV